MTKSIDDCWESISWAEVRYMELRSRTLRDAVWLSAIRRLEDIKSLQEDFECRLQSS